jgi:LmbE family N-acetylglucosaminyl deacetylase
MKKNILVVVAHSDDETISMGGTIRKHITNGDSVIAISMTDGVSSRANTDIKEISKRTDSAQLASRILGFKWGECFNFKDNAMDSYPLIEIVKCIEESKKKYQPNLVYTHSGADLNIDHRVVANAVLTAFRPEPGEICKEIRLFEVPSATDYGHKSLTGIFNPNVFISIDNEWGFKEEALKAYNKEMRLYPHSRSIQGISNLARLRGSQVGFNMAEAFEVIRKLED